MSTKKPSLRSAEGIARAIRAAHRLGAGYPQTKNTGMLAKRLPEVEDAMLRDALKRAPGRPVPLRATTPPRPVTSVTPPKAQPPQKPVFEPFNDPDYPD